MTHSEQEEVLRRALHAVADSIEPAADGLERIRERLSKPRPLAVAWLMAGWTGLAQPMLLRMEPVLAGAAGRLSDRLGEWLRLMLAALRAAAARLRPAGARLRLGVERLRPVGELLVDAVRMLRPGSGMSRHEKLRSALAFGAAALIGAAGGLALSDGLPQQMFSVATQALSLSQPHKAGHDGHNPNENGNGQQALTPGSSGTPSGNHGASPSPSSSCHPKPNPSSLPSVTPPSSTPPTTVPPTTIPPTTIPPSTTPPSTTPPTTTPPTTTPPSTNPAIPGSTPAGLHATASPGPGPSFTNNPAARTGNRGSGGGQPPTTTTPPVGGSTAKPTPSAGTSGCS